MKYNFSANILCFVAHINAILWFKNCTFQGTDSEQVLTAQQSC